MKVLVRTLCLTTHKMLVGGNGWKVWGTYPTKLYDAEKGDTVRFVATVEASEDDAAFGFFKRPKACEIVKVAETAEAS